MRTDVGKCSFGSKTGQKQRSSRIPEPTNVYACLWAQQSLLRPFHKPGIVLIEYIWETCLHYLGFIIIDSKHYR